MYKYIYIFIYQIFLDTEVYIKNNIYKKINRKKLEDQNSV